MEDFTHWHSIRPWRPTLSLSVREITSVSTTFILSSPFTGHIVDPLDSDPSLSISSSEDDDNSPESSTASRSQVVSDVLAKGLSVKVNGLPWQRVLMKIDDEADEAVIILFGLMPGRQYGIELGILPEETFIRGKITTDADPVPFNGEASGSGYIPADVPGADTLVSTSPDSGGVVHTPPALSAAPSNSSASPGITLEERHHQLTHTLNLLNAEHTSLTSALKSARRESQKADAALRSEIETLRRASDRHAAGEHRARQKVLALQEAVKQTSAAATEITALLADVEAALPGLEKRRTVVEQEWRTVNAAAQKVRAAREEEERKEKRRTEALQAELAALCNRLERLNGRKDKLEGEGGVLEELEKRLKGLEEERERIENDPYGYEGETADRSVQSREDDIQEDGDEGKGLYYLPRPHSHAHPTAPRRPHLSQHPVHAHSSSHIHHHHHPRSSYPPPTRLVGRPEPIQRPRQSFPMSGLPHKPRHPVHVLGAGSASGSSSGSSSVQSATPALVPTSPINSTLSSRAPPFEPSGRTAIVTSTSKSELNPGSAPFTLRAGAVQAMHVQQSDGNQVSVRR